MLRIIDRHRTVLTKTLSKEIETSKGFTSTLIELDKKVSPCTKLSSERRGEKKDYV